MNFPICYFLTLLILFAGCSTSREANEPDRSESDHSEHFLQATIQHWFASPIPDGSFAERGIDIVISLRDWLPGNEVKSVIYDGRRSFPANMTASENDTVTVEARIVVESSVIERSESSRLSDRLIYFDESGEEQFLEIRRWEYLPNRYYSPGTED